MVLFPSKTKHQKGSVPLTELCHTNITVIIVNRNNTVTLVSKLLTCPPT